MKISLKLLKETDINKIYLQWFLDADVVRFSDNQYLKFSLTNEKKYVKNCIANKDVDLYGIYSEARLVGNVAISGLTSKHKRAEISYVVGDKKHWNKGIGTIAIKEIIKKAINIYKLKKLYAGVVENNFGSIKVLEKNKFILEGKRLKHLFYNGKYYNQLDYGLLLKK